jgi:hypothetical protein
MNRHSFIPCILLTIGMTTAAVAQVDILVTHTTQFNAHTGPVTLFFGQPAALANASDYRVKVVDFDRNGDGRISRREIPPFHALNFEFHLVDHDHDGYLTDEELRRSNWQ